jgi:hypothetical protein
MFHTYYVVMIEIQVLKFTVLSFLDLTSTNLVDS